MTGGCCPGAEEAFAAGFRLGAEFALGIVAGRQGAVADEVAWALRLSQAVGEPLSVELVMGAVGRAVERAEERVSLLLPSEASFRWHLLTEREGRGNGRVKGSHGPGGREQLRQERWSG